MTIRDICVAFGYEVSKQSEQKVENSIKSIKSFATKAFSAIGIGFSLVKLKDLSEEFGGINDKIRDATRGMGDQADIQQTILKAANDTRQSYGDMADNISRLAQNKDAFDGVEDAANFASLLAKNFAASGKNSAQVSSLMQTVTSSISKGVVDSRTMMTLFKESPDTLRMMADSLGVTIETLQDMVSKGKVSAQTLKRVFQQNSASIEGRFGELDLTISDALLNVRNQWGHFVAELDGSLKITKNISKFIVRGFSKLMEYLKKGVTWVERLSKRFGGMDRLMKLLAISAGAIFIALNAGKIMSFLSGVGKMLGGINLKTLALVAVIIILALLIEDFINFIQGNNSVIGEMFAKAGIDAEGFRDKVAGVIQKVKSTVGAAFEFIKKKTGGLWDGLKKGDTLKNFIELIIALKNLFSALLKPIKQVAKDIFGMFPKPNESGLQWFVSEGLPKLISFITTAVKKVTDIINKMNELGISGALIKGLLFSFLGFKAISGVSKGLDGFAGIVTNIGLKLKSLGGVATKLLKPFKTIISVFTKNPFMIWIAAIVALIAIFTLLFKNKEKTKEFIDVIKNKIKDFINIAKDIVKKIVEMLPELIKMGIEIVKSLIDGIVQILPQLIETFVGFIDLIVNAITENLPTLIETGIQILTWLIQGIVDTIPKIIQAVITLINTLISGIMKFLPVIIRAGIDILMALIRGIIKVLPQLIKAAIQIIQAIIKAITENLPVIIEAGISILMSLIDGILNALPQLIDAAIQLITSILDAIIENLPIIIEAGIQILMALIDGILQILPQLIEAAILLITSILNAIVENLPVIIEAGIQVLMALIDGILQVLPQLIQAAILLITNILSAIVENLPQIIDAGIKILVSLIQGIIEAIPQLIEALPQVISAIVEGLASLSNMLFDIGIDVIKSLWDGICSVASWIGEKVGGFFKNLFGGKNKVEVDIETNADKKGKGSVQGFASGTNRTPDTFIAGEEGPELITGAKDRKVFDALQTGDIFKTLRDMVMMAAKPQTATVAATTSSVENKVITQNVNITNEFKGGTMEAQKQGAKAMNQAADDTTSQLARALAYSR